MAHYLEIARAAVHMIDILQARIAGARDWDDLRAVVTDAEVAYTAGRLTGSEVDQLAKQCNEVAGARPLRADPCLTCDGRDWWMSGRDGGIRCQTCTPPGEDEHTWPPQEMAE